MLIVDAGLFAQHGGGRPNILQGIVVKFTDPAGKQILRRVWSLHASLCKAQHANLQYFRAGSASVKCAKDIASPADYRLLFPNLMCGSVWCSRCGNSSSSCSAGPAACLTSLPVKSKPFALMNAQPGVDVLFLMH